MKNPIIKIIILNLLLLLGINSYSQYVTIPDTNFRNWLITNHPSIMVGGMLDTNATSEITELDIRDLDIYSIEGIQYFNNLIRLHCDWNYISYISDLPNNLVIFTIAVNGLDSIRYFPNTIEYLVLMNNELTQLPTLPDSLNIFDCSTNYLHILPSLPENIEILNCSGNLLDSLPYLPENTKHISCDHNSLDFLPILPPSVFFLSCAYNNISSISSVPRNLYIQNNNLEYLPNINSSNYLNINISNNPINCLPILPDSTYLLIIHSTGITCMPNYPSKLFEADMAVWPLNPFSLPICSSNSDCPLDTHITGKIYLDVNDNCVQLLEPNLTNIKVDLLDSLGNYVQSFYSLIASPNQGVYNFSVNSEKYVVKIDTSNIPYLFTCVNPGMDTTIIVTSIENDSIDFPLTCKPGYDIGLSTIIRRSGMFFPGQNAIVNILAGDMAMFNGVTCNTSGLGGTLQISYSGLASYVSAAPGSLIPSISGSTLTYTISDFSTVNPNDFQIIMHTDTSASIGDLICFDATITPSDGDYNLTNQVLTHCFEVVNSYDPNIKEVYPTDQLAYPFNDWLNYTIHFQNTGSAPAINIRLADTLDTDLNIQSFQLLGYSHPVEVSIYNGIVSFYFNNINLIDSTTNEPFSKGYVSYRIKPIDTPPVGTEIKNKAYIYFDYNTPILTNTTNNVVSWVGLEEEFSIPFSVYPNPTTEAVNLNFGDIITSKKIELVNMLGQVIYSIETSNSLIQIPVINHTKGLYLIKVTQNGLCKSKRLIVH